MAILHVTTGDYAGKTYQLTANQMVVGRYAFCDIVFDDHSISREHAQFIRDSDSYFVEDLGSLNGTYVNGERIRGRVQLRDGDHIRLFKIELNFFEGSEPGATEGSYQHFEDDQAEEEHPRSRIVNLGDTIGSQGSAHVRLKAVIEFTRSLGSTLSIDDILPKIMDSAFRIFPQSERGYILRGGDASGGLTPFAIRHRRQAPDAPPPTFGPLNQRLAQKVLDRGEAMLVDDASEEGSVLDEQFRSTICAPIMGPSHNPLGVIHIETNDSANRFDAEDLEVLASVASIAGQAIEYAMLHEARMHHERRKRELAMAKQVQRHFLPRRTPTAKGFKFYHHYRPAQEVGGDYFGYIPLAGDRLALAGLEAMTGLLVRAFVFEPVAGDLAGLLQHLPGALPERAAADGATGVVDVQFIVTPRGRATRVRTINTVHNALRTEASRIVNQLRFRPGTVAGAPVPVEVRLSIRFTGRE